LLGHEANCSSLSSVEVKNEWSSTSILSFTFLVVHNRMLDNNGYV
jgi:hypothetical protein